MAELVKKYQQYEEYKETGIEWLGKIPSSWRTGSLRWMIDIASGESLPSNCEKEYSKENQFPVVGGNGVMGFSNKVNTADAAIAVGRVGALCGNIHSIDYDSWITDNALKISKWNKFSKDFLVYLLKTANLNDLASKTAQPLITGEQVKSLKVVLLPIAEQKKIANFLDHETAQIDTLIEKQQTLIQLLKEKRQAVITHAVTKGLNPDAPMKDSGVEWLGDVPEHWELTKIKYIAELTPSKAKILPSLEKRCSFVPMEKLKLDTLILDETRKIKDVYQGYTYFEDGDVLIAKVTPCFENQNMAIAANLVNGIGFGSSEIYVLRTEAEGLNKFLLYRLQESVFMQLGTGAMTGAGGLRRVPSDFINDFQFALPPINEQQEIVAYIEKMKNTFNDLVYKAEQAIQLMQERRTALISAAVTGKIDVRGWVAPA